MKKNNYSTPSAVVLYVPAEDVMTASLAYNDEGNGDSIGFDQIFSD